MIVGWGERSETHHIPAIVDGFRCALPILRSEPLQHAPARRGPRRERGLQQIAAGRGFPVEHLAGGEGAGQATDHEIGVDFAKGDSACGRDRARDRRASDFGRIAEMAKIAAALTRWR